MTASVTLGVWAPGWHILEQVIGKLWPEGLIWPSAYFV